MPSKISAVLRFHEAVQPIKDVFARRLMWNGQKYRPVRVKMTTLFSPQSSLLIVNLNHSQLAAAQWSTKQVSFARHRFCRKSDTNEVLLASSSSSYLPPRSHVTPLHASRTLGETKERMENVTKCQIRLMLHRIMVQSAHRFKQCGPEQMGGILTELHCREMVQSPFVSIFA